MILLVIGSLIAPLKANGMSIIQAMEAYLPNVHADVHKALLELAARADQERLAGNVYAAGVLQQRIIDLAVRGRALKLIQEQIELIT